MQIRIALLGLGLLLAIPVRVFSLGMVELGPAGFTRLSGEGTVSQEVASLRLDLGEKSRELRVTSPEFPVRAWMIYRVAMRQRLEPALQVRLTVQLFNGTRWQDLRPTDADGGYRFGTRPDSTRGRMVITLASIGTPIGHVGLLDDIAIDEWAPILIREHSANLYWDGGLELSDSSPPWDWSYWVNKPSVFIRSDVRPHGGKFFAHVEGGNTYLVLPSITAFPHRLYRLRLWVRGTAVIFPGMHKLSWDGTQRIGWETAVVERVPLTEDAWQLVEFIAPCERDECMLLHPVLVMTKGSLDVDDVECHALADTEPPGE